jgi:hypothetical protein
MHQPQLKHCPVTTLHNLVCLVDLVALRLEQRWQLELDAFFDNIFDIAQPYLQFTTIGLTMHLIRSIAQPTQPEEVSVMRDDEESQQGKHQRHPLMYLHPFHFRCYPQRRKFAASSGNFLRLHIRSVAVQYLHGQEKIMLDTLCQTTNCLVAADLCRDAFKFLQQVREFF